MKLSLNTLSALLVQRIYRLALTATGNHKVASSITVQLFSHIDFPTHDPESAALIQLFEQLKSLDKDMWKLKKPVPADKQADQELEALLKVLRKASPQARFMLALYSLWGMPPSEISQLLGQSVDELHSLRVDLALARGLVASQSERQELEGLVRFIANDLSEAAQTGQRAALLNSAQARSLRNSLVSNDEQLGQLLASVFSTATPSDLIAKIEQQSQTPPRRRRLKRSLLFNLSVIAIVATMIGLLLVWPQTRSEAKSERPVSSVSTRELNSLIEAALERVEKPVLGQGLLHERYAITIEQRSWQLERWYDLGDPQRFALAWRSDHDPASFYRVKADGSGALEINSFNERVAVELEPDRLTQLKPILLQYPNLDIHGTLQLDQFFLKQALENRAYSMGTSQFLSRPVTLIAYPAERFLPNEWVNPANTRRGYNSALVFLTLDNQTLSLLQAQVLLENQQGSTIITPWRAEQFSIDEQADPELFAIAGERNDELFSPRILFGEHIQTAKSVSLDSTFERSDQASQIYLPASVVEQSLWARMLYENARQGEVFHILLEDTYRQSILSIPMWGGNWALPNEQNKRVGSFSYVVDHSPFITEVSLIHKTGQKFELSIIDLSSSESELESYIEAFINSLEPLTVDNIDRFKPKFIEP